MSLLTYQTCGDENPECVILFGFYSGIVELVLGLLELGNNGQMIASEILGVTHEVR